MEKFSYNTQTYLQNYHLDLNYMIQSMTTVQLTDSISHNFIVQMIPHHEMAIHMCKNLLQYTTNIALQNMAHDIIMEQRESIRKLQQCLQNCSKLQNPPTQVSHYQQHYAKVTDTMFCQMEQACQGNDIDANFCREMIPHHLGALEMCQNVLQFDICDELCPIIESILVMQMKGVKELQCILRSL